MTNVVAYYEHSKITDVKVFYNIGPRPERLAIKKTRQLICPGPQQQSFLKLTPVRSYVCKLSSTTILTNDDIVVADKRLMRCHSCKSLFPDLSRRVCLITAAFAKSRMRQHIKVLRTCTQLTILHYTYLAQRLTVIMIISRVRGSTP